MIGLSDFLLGGLVPLVAAAAICAIVWKLARREGASWSAGLIAGYAAGAVALEARDSGIAAAAVRLVRASESHEWLPLMALVATVPAAVAAAARRPWVERALAAPIAAGAPAWLLWSKYRASEQLRDAGFAEGAITPAGAAAVLAGVAGAIFAAWFLWSRAPGAGTLPKTRGLLAIVATIGAAAAAALTGALVYGQHLGVLAAALAGCAAVGWGVGAPAGPDRARGPALMLLGGLLVVAATYSKLPPWHAAALAAAFVLPVAPLWRAARLRPAAEAGVRAAVCLVPVAIVVGIAAATFAANERQQRQQEAADPYADYLGAK